MHYKFGEGTDYNVRWGEVFKGNNLKRNLATAAGSVLINLPWNRFLYNTYGGRSYKFYFHGIGTIGGH